MPFFVKKRTLEVKCRRPCRSRGVQWYVHFIVFSSWLINCILYCPITALNSRVERCFWPLKPIVRPYTSALLIFLRWFTFLQEKRDWKARKSWATSRRCSRRGCRKRARCWNVVISSKQRSRSKASWTTSSDSSLRGQTTAKSENYFPYLLQRSSQIFFLEAELHHVFVFNHRL